MTASALDRAARALLARHSYGQEAGGRWRVSLPGAHFRPGGAPLQTEEEAVMAALREDARAVLAALDPPSPGMVQAGERAIFWADPSGSVERGWTAMLAAAREGA